MTIGRRDKLVTLQRATPTTDDYGGETLAWGPIGGGATPTQEWAAVFYGRGTERRQAAQTQASQAATFQMLSNLTTRGLLAKDRIVHLSANWDIAGPPALDTPEPGLVEVEATRAA